MSYEIPTLIGSLVDRAIRWERNLDPIWREHCRRLGRAQANSYQSYDPRFGIPMLPVGIASPFFGQGLIGPYQGLGGIQAQAQHPWVTEFFGAQQTQYSRKKKPKKRILSTNRYL